MNKSYRNNVNKDYNLKNLDDCLELVNKNVKFPLNSGKQGNTFKIHSDKCGSAVLKEYYLEDHENSIKKITELESRILLLLKSFIKKNICPNFIELYYYNNKIPYILMEYADGDCKFLFKDDYVSTEIYESFICQILLGLLCLHTQTLIYHRDLKPANLLYKNIEKKIIFHYKINGEDFYIPTYGYLFMIADYGRASLELGEYSEEKNLATQIEECYSQFLKNKYETTTKFLEIFNKTEQNILKNIIKKQNLDLKKLINFTIQKGFLKQKLNVNDFIYKIYGLLVSKIPIPQILNKYFSKFKNKNDYKDEDIVTFTFNYQ